MKVISYQLEPSAHFKLTRAEWDILMKLSAEHYDGLCRNISSPGEKSFLYGWSWAFKAYEGGEPVQLDEAEVEATVHQLDILCKVTEELYLPNRIGQKLHYDLLDLLRATGSQRKTVPVEVG